MEYLLKLNRLRHIIVLATIIVSCKSQYPYITPQGNASIMKRTYGSSIIYRTIYEAPGDGIIDGPYVKLTTDSSSLIILGQEKSIYITDLKGNKYVTAVNTGTWYYYGENEEVDSIVTYQGIQDINYSIDTLWSDGSPIAIDSSITPVYNKRIVYSSAGAN